jgi:hypothetical protein
MYWGLIVYTPTGFAWAMGSTERITLVNERLDMIDLGISPSRMFINRFDNELSEVEQHKLICVMNRLDNVFNRYLPE